MRIFLIYSNTRQYEEHNIVIGFKYTEDEAKTTVQALKEDYSKARNFADEILYPAMKKFREANPSKHISFHDIPKWPAGISQNQITAEMRAEREEYKNKNESIRQANIDATVESYRKEMEFLKPIIDTVVNEPWFKKWFTLKDNSISCRAANLVKGEEFIYESCDELK